MTSIHYIIIGISLALILVLIELYKPARKYSAAEKKSSYITNIFIFLCNNIITFLLQITIIATFAHSFSPAQNVYELLPVFAQVAVGIIVLDLSIWIWHMLNHRIDFLWKFHKCHHSEKYLNATSALRFHIGELLLSVVWKSAVLIITGIPIWIFILSEFLLTGFAMFHHANISLSRNFRGLFEKFFISPYLHRVHHSTERHEHDTNYGVIFSFWDILFKTMKRIIPDTIGLDGVSTKNFFSFTLFPFSKK
jgi:sterol desaturase/sphingolipid hydroxylase (fatty acid hydroxylase superfamily)